MSQEDTHTIKFIKVGTGSRINYKHAFGGHFLGIIPTPGRTVGAYMVFALHPGQQEPFKKRGS